MDETIDTRLPYRVGCPNLLVLPVQRDFLTNFKLPDPLQFISILQNNSVAHEVVIAVKQYNRGNPLNYQDTLQIQALYTSTECTERWAKAAQEVKNLLNANGFVDFAVEIIDIKVVIGLQTSAIEPTDTGIIQSWLALEQTFLSAISSYEVLAIDFLCREYPLQGLVPSIIITSKDANKESWWSSTLPLLRHKLGEYGAELHVEIVLLYNDKLNLAMNERDISEDQAREYLRKRKKTVQNRKLNTLKKEEWPASQEIVKNFYQGPNMGSSCGSLRSNRTLTLGGQITLQSNKSEIFLGLTNFHLLHEEEFESPGPYPPLSAPSGLPVMSPSNSDHGHFIQNTKKRLRDAVYHGLEPNNDVIVEYHTCRIDEHRLRVAESSDCALGSVYAGSGYTKRDNNRYKDFVTDWAMDWCLIKMSAEIRNWFRHEDGKIVADTYSSISAFEPYNVCKISRTSGFNYGQIVTMPSYIRAKCIENETERAKLAARQLALQDLNIVETTLNYFAGFVKCHAMVSSDKTDEFLKPGDSGSFILLSKKGEDAGEDAGEDEGEDAEEDTEEGTILGVGFASNDSSLVSYMMPMDLVINSIEEVTGGKVMYPKFAGNV
ncbi:hypothetical protein EJ04DRAFT_251443 [Polyplosphaeria fusca]|uniref:Uncharacterized protein n=1 Tax=Polyplosphaeria fusca TaxID=682080 RepID=A0A9P4V2F5_9PLEO|nr:hypothetical protein EJ04DRAFT_251443 [Polyplosphaeria fusca]